MEDLNNSTQFLVKVMTNTVDREIFVVKNFSWSSRKTKI